MASLAIRFIFRMVHGGTAWVGLLLTREQARNDTHKLGLEPGSPGIKL